ncbi:PilZ domain-containing protein [Photobacterium sp. 1_MG-2023]|uniref:PilZ domain-containing protein n=1 Tax=Photobacterium sp. 1_MG-2023 TaxID=3062646 RepID=UPI0026E32DFA|nr:PilZ domain-containing protein [Photobacterium sp. 1_MG-2023]MDO6704712.1 PilZ domain-containing protein [Photobacterium sp. 1_MG-2023]
MKERRQFIRIVYQAPATLQQAGATWHTTLKDISLHGVLLSRPVDWPQREDNTFDVDIVLPQTDVHLTMAAELIEQDETTLRMKIAHIDIDSLSHLRRLIELNLGDDALLHRELEHLTDLAADE